MSVFSKCWARFRGGFGPVDYTGFEVFVIRFCFAGIVLLALPDKGDVGGLVRQETPVGLAHFMDLTWAAGSLDILWWVIAGSLLFYVAGYFLWLALPVATFSFCAVGGLWNSQGITRHTIQVVGLVLLVQTIYYVYARARLWRGAKGAADGRDQHQIAIWYSQQVIAAAYVITAITKVVNSWGQWVKDSKYFPLQIEKTRLSDHYNHLGLEEVPAASPEVSANLWERSVGMLDGLSMVIQNYLVANPNMCRTFLTIGLALEFFAFLALRGRLALFLYGVALIGFHLTIGRVMNLHFTIHNLVILVFFVNIPFLFVLVWRKFFSTRIGSRNGGMRAASLEHSTPDTGS